MRAYALLGACKPFLYVFTALFVVVQGISIVSTLLMLGPVLKAADRTNVAGLNVCDVGTTASFSWVTPTSDTLWMTYETILCGAVVRYAFREIPTSSWKSPTRSVGALLRVIIRDNLIHFFIVTFSLLMATLNATGVTSNVSVIDHGNVFLVSLQVAMIGPWIIINLRRSYEQTAHAGTSSFWEMTTVEFANDESWQKSEHEVGGARYSASGRRSYTLA